MATLIWTGAASQLFNVAGNYLDASTLATPASAPANNDTIIYDRGGVDVDPATTGITGVTMIGTPGYKGRIAPGGSLSIALASLNWTAGSLALAGNITLGKVKCRTGTKLTLASGTAADLSLEGDASILAAAVLTTAYINGRHNIDIAYNATAITKLECRGGTQIVTHRTGKYDVGDNCLVEARSAAALSDGTVVRDYGLLRDLSSADVPGDLIVERFGEYDPSGSNADKTIDQRILWPGAKAGNATRFGPITLTNPDKVLGVSAVLGNYANEGGPTPR